MKLLNYSQMIREHGWQQVTSTNLFLATGTPDPDGLVSNRIFGITAEDRQTLCGWIDLGEEFLLPVIYKRIFKRSFRAIDEIISGAAKYSIDKDGNLVPDENGGTGLRWLYKNFEKIKFKNINIPLEEGESPEDESFFKQNVRSILAKHDKTQLFTNKFIIIPLAFRDVDIKDSTMGLDELNGMYRNLMNKVKMLKQNKDVTLFDSDRLRYQIQIQLAELHDYYKGLVGGKYGLQRKKALSKNVDFGSICVLSGREFSDDKFEEKAINIDRTGFPLTAMVANAHLFLKRRMIEFLKSLTMVDKKGKLILLRDKELFYDGEKIGEYIDTYIHSVSERLTIIETPVGTPVYFEYKENGQEKKRPLTITDLMYLFAYSELEVQNRHAMITRHPTMDSFNIIPTKIHVLSTTRTKKIEAYGTEYPYYPDIDSIFKEYNLDDVDDALEAEAIISGFFVESQKMSNLHLAGQNGDLDGDKNIVRILFSDEANAEADRKMNEISYAFDQKLSNVKVLGKDAQSGLYSFTAFRKNYTNYAKADMVNKLLTVKPEDIGISFLFKDIRLCDTTKFKKETDVHDLMKLEPNVVNMPGNKEIIYTVGQYIVWKLFLAEAKMPIVCEPWTTKVLQKNFKNMGLKIKDKDVDFATYKRAINRYESFTLRMSSFIAPSINLDMLCTTPDIKALKKRLIEENKEALDKGDVIVWDKIEKEVINKVKETYGNDEDFELYDSGTVKLGNQYKTMALFAGPMPQDTDMEKFHIVTNSLNEGIEKKDLSYVSNTGVIGGFSRGKEPEIGGALAKLANYVYQTIRLDKHGTDCKTKEYLTFIIPDKYKEEYIGRYVVDGGEDILLTKENISKYLNKEIKLRSILTCKSPLVCSKCAGEFLYDYYGIFDKPIDVGLKLSKQQHELVQKRLKLSHDVTVNLVDFDFDNVKESTKKGKRLLK